MSSLFRIVDKTRSSDSYFYSNTSYEFEVISIKSEQVICTLLGKWDEGTTYCRKEGVESAKFIDDTTLEITNFDGTKEKREITE
jgi:hypothetical protein